MYGMMAWTVYVSTNDWVGMAPRWDFSGLKNYATLFGMERFWVNLKNNLIWLGVFIAPTALLGLLLAYALDLSGRAEKLFRPLFLYPLALSFVVTGTLWAWMYDPESGVINNILRGLGLGRLAQPWIADPGQATFCLIGAAIWQYTGFAMTIYLAAIRDIPRETTEAARVDGASEYQIFALVLPLVRPAIGAIGIFTMIPIWNDLWFPLILAPSEGTATVTLGVQQFLGQFVSDWNAVLAALTLAMVPILLLYLVFSRQLLRGLTSGAIK